MRDFFSESNLVKASGLAAVVTVMSVGRLIEGGRPPGLFIPATFLLLVFICGAVTAWGTRAGMAGIVTDRSTFLRGAAAAGILSLVALPVHVLWLDPLLRGALAAKPQFLELSYPTTPRGCMASLLWSAGFQVMFLQAAPMSLFARLTNRRSVAMAMCIALRAYIATRQVGLIGIADHGALFVLCAVAATAAGCAVFARFGLGPTMLLAAGLDAHILVHWR